MEKTKKPLTAYDFLQREIREYYKQEFNHASPEQRSVTLSNMQDALFGLETLSDVKIAKLVKNPQAHFYIIHNLHLPKKFRATAHESSSSENYQEVVRDLSCLGYSTRKVEKLRKKLQPFLIIATLLSAGAAIYAAKTERNPNLAIVASATALTLFAHNRLQTNLLPPYPKTPDLTH